MAKKASYKASYVVGVNFDGPIVVDHFYESDEISTQAVAQKEEIILRPRKAHLKRKFGKK